MGIHDATYAILFSHPYLVESLLRGFLPAHWTDRFDFESLEPASEAHGTEDWSKRTKMPELLPGAEHEALRTDIVRWIQEIVLPSRLEGVNFPQVTRLEEVVEMLAAHAPDWTAKWRNEGRQEGEAALLLRLLARRFGSLDPSLRRKIESADADQLLEWGDRFVTARSLLEIFPNGR